MRAAAHLTHQALLLHLAAKFAQGLFELFLISDDDFQTGGNNNGLQDLVESGPVMGPSVSSGA